MIGRPEDRRGRGPKVWDACLRRGEALLVGIAWAVKGWCRSRNFRYLLQGLPAVVAGAGVMLLTAHLALMPRGELVARYQHEARRALQAGEYSAAQKCYERLAILRGDEPDVRHGLALVAQAQGRPEQARALFDSLAPLDRHGYGPAHLWQAQRLLTGSNPSPRDLQDAETHLRRVLQGQPDEPEAHARLGQLYLATGRLGEAEPHLLCAAEARPGLRLSLARLYQARDRQDVARRQAEQAVEFFRPQAKADVDNHQARLSWAAATVILEDYPAAVTILEPGVALPHSEPYRRALAGVYAAWSDAKNKPGERLALLEQGLKHDPTSVALLQKLIAVAKAGDAEAARANVTLQKLLAQGKTAATVHMLLGMDASQRGEADVARRHYEESYRLDPQNDVVANNLAWALAHSEPADLPRALALINSVLERRPGQPRFRHTQETILGQMQGPAAQPGRRAGEGEAIAPEFFRQTGAPKKIEAIDQGIACFRRREYEQALKLLQSACKQHPDLPLAQVMLARLYLADGQAAPARSSFDKAAEEHPEHPSIYLGFGMLALAEGRRREAPLHFEKVAALVKAGKWADGPRRYYLSQSHAGQAAVAESRGDWPAAQAALAAWLELEPKNGVARQRLARAFLELDKPVEALRELEQAARDDATMLPAGVALGWLYARKGDRPKAARTMQEAVNKAPDDPRVQLGVATWLLRQGQVEESKTHADTAARLGLDSKELKLLRGLIARYRKDYAEAESHFRAVHQESPEDLRASNQLALVLVEQVDQAKQQLALRLAEANVRVYPRSAEARATLGRVYHRLGRLEEAERALQAAVPGGKASPETAYYLACVLADLGRTERAKKLLKAALEADGFFLYRKEAQERLDQLDNKP